MGIISDVLRIGNRAPPFPQHQGILGTGQPQTDYMAYGRAYSSNEIVFAAIELLASSAAEPHISGRRWRRNKAIVRAAKASYEARGLRRVNAFLREIKNGYVEELPDHPLVRLLNDPNPFMSRGQMWGTVVMDRALAGNSYLLKARVEGGPMRGAVAELWRLRPDRVRVIPDASKFIAGYEYNTGSEKVCYPAEDIIHFKTRNPLNDYYGMPPLMAIAGRVDIDQYMKSFLRTFFESGGTGPGSILTIKQRASQEQKDEMRKRFGRQFGGSDGFHGMMVLDQAETSYQQLGLDRGLRDALPKELNAVQESRIAMAFGIPGSILGLLIGYESSSYANKRADWQVLWDITMAPLMSDLDDVLNLSLMPDFGQIDEVYFDLDDIKALQEDVDAIQERERKNFQVGLTSFEEARDAIGRDPDIGEGTFYIPANVKPVEFDDLTKEPEPPALPPVLPEPEEVAAIAAIVAAPKCPRCMRGNGRNVQVGAALMCRSCKAEFIVSDNGRLTT